MILQNLLVKQRPDCTYGRLYLPTHKIVCAAILSMAQHFTKGVSVDVLYL